MAGNLRPQPFGFPVVSPWPVGFQPVPPAPIPPPPQQQEAGGMGGGMGLGGGAPGGAPLFPNLAARFPRLAQAGQAIRGFAENFDERFPRVGEFRRNNSDMLSNVGMALLTTRPGDNAPVREAFYMGRQSDQQRRAAQSQAEQEAEANRIWGQFLGGGQGTAPAGTAGPSAPLPPDIQAFFQERAPGLRVEGMDPAFAASLAQAAADYERETGQRASFTSLARTREEQEELYASYQRGEIGLAAPPGRSRHESGAAADIPSGPFLQWMQANASRYGLSFLPGRAGEIDPGHIQMAGAPAGGQAPAAQGQPQARFTPQEQVQLQAMLSNPQTAGIAQQIIAERMFTQPAPTTYGFEEVGGTLLRTDPRAGTAEEVFTAPTDAPGLDFGDENALRTQFNQLTAPFRDTAQAFERIQVAYASPSAASDVSMIFAYMRMLDPASTVREGEFATAQNTTGVPGQIVNLYNRLLTGERLNDAQRQDFFQQAQGLSQAAVDQYNQYADFYRQIAPQYGVDPTRIILPLGAPPANNEDTGNAADPTTWRTATSPTTGERVRLNPTTNQWEPF